MKQEIIQGDCLEIMQGMEDNSIDFIVTDPPYGLSFMGKNWDKECPSVDIWKEVLRICKPGSMLAAFGGSRTHHHLMITLEQAGWEIRDVIMWLYGSGFPKSMDIGKAIDKKKASLDDIHKVCCWIADQCEQRVISKTDLDFAAGTSNMASWWTSRLRNRCQIPTLEHWNRLKTIIGECPEWMNELIKPAFEPHENYQKREIIPTTGNLHLGNGNTVGCFTGKQRSNIGTSILAQTFSGYGTALKPAYEPIILAMKPLEGTFAQNAEKWGVAGINIDESRISMTQKDFECYKEKKESFNGTIGQTSSFMSSPLNNHIETKGRWPANLILDEEAAEMLNEQVGYLSGAGNKIGSQRIVHNHGFCTSSERINNKYDNGGGASRFFYCAKASSKERGENNTHPTVKPISLMKYIIKLLASPGSPTLLDPFCGSGSTLIAAKELGINAIGIEKQEEYCQIALNRIQYF